MPLEQQAPPLEQLTYEELKRQAILRIPRYTPEWTDFNESDPGITLIELLAWLSELLLVQMNRVPDRVYIKLLQQLGMELRPAQPAEAHLVFTPQAGAVVDPIPPHTQIGGTPAGGDELIFETATGLSLIRLQLTDVQVFDGAAFTVVTRLNQDPTASFRPFGWQPLPGSALYLGFTQTDPPALAPVFPDSMSWRVFLPPEAQQAVPVSGAQVAGDLPPAPVSLEWEYHPATNPHRWKRLQIYSDRSVGLTREGYIQVQGPADPIQTEEGRVAGRRFWLRVRLAGGAYPAGHAPVLDAILPNVVAAVNLSTVQEEVVGESQGHFGQVFTLERTPIEASSLELYTQDSDNNTEDWQRRDDLLASGPEDPHFTLNSSSGEIRFGDGINGRIPGAGLLIIARRYRYGGGQAGNLPAGGINAVLSALVGIEDVSNPRPAVSGRDEENIADFLKNAPANLRHRNRAISAEDYRLLAAEAGGVHKAIALPGAHPSFPGSQVAGAVTVVIIPDTDDMPPRPSQQQLEVVCRYLNERRLLTTELYVQPPDYIEIKVEARVFCRPFASTDRVRNDIIQAINASLDPRGVRKPPAGLMGAFSRLGGEFGVDFYPTAVFSIIQSVADVVAVDYLAVNGQEGAELSQAIRVPPNALIYGSSEHAITVVPYQESA